MQNIVNLSSSAIILLAEAASRADAEGRRLRVCVEGGTFKYKVGEGMWSAPFYDQEDPYRDPAPVESLVWVLVDTEGEVIERFASVEAVLSNPRVTEEGCKIHHEPFPDHTLTL